MTRRGVALLEVLIALTIFSIAALAAIEQLGQLAASEVQSEARERRLADADRLMTAMSLLTREDLDRRLGSRVIGPWVVEIQRPRPVLYRVTVGTGDAPDVATLLYRPEPRREF